MRIFHYLKISILISILLIGCGKKEQIEIKQMNSMPIDIPNIKALVPLGNLNPPSHVFPTDHMYFYYKDPKVKVNIYAPTSIPIFQISENTHNIGLPDEWKDYEIKFGDQENNIYYSHIPELSEKIKNAIGNFPQNNCKEYIAGQVTHKTCILEKNIAINPGEVVGTNGGNPNRAAFDMGMVKNGKSVCPLEFFGENTRQLLQNMIKSWDGVTKRVAEPLCGEINQNIASTVQGQWQQKGLPKYPEDPHIALVRDNIQTNIPVFSIGADVKGLASNLYTFVVANDGLINRDFNTVKATGDIYCYEYSNMVDKMVYPNVSIILQLLDDNTLKLEKKDCDCKQGPYQFTGNAKEYTRLTL